MASPERERLLLHWVNSLPLASCLMVDELADLRFGDVLADIARWVQLRRLGVWGDRLATGEPKMPSVDRVGAVGRVRAVVQLAASESRSADGDAVFVLHSADCVARVMEGDCEAIGAVVGVLKRLSHQLPPCRPASPTAAVKLRALRAVLMKQKPTAIDGDEPNKSKSWTRAASAVANRAPSDPKIEAAQPTQGPPLTEKRVTPKVRARRPRGSTSAPNSRKTAVVASAPDARPLDARPLLSPSRSFRDEDGLHVFGMLDPTAKSKAPKRDTSVHDECDDDKMRRTHQWLAETLGVELPLPMHIPDSRQRLPRKTKLRRTPSKPSARAQRCQSLKPFQDGVLLCQIAGSALRLAGRDTRLSTSDGGLQGFERCPRARADSIRNIALARSVFRSLGVSDHLLEALDGGLADPSSPMQVAAVWRALDELRGIHSSRGFSSPATRSTSKRSIRAGDRLLHAKVQSGGVDRSGEDNSQDRCVDATKRAYVSAEQCAVVDSWLSSLGLPTQRDRSGVLQDAVRNGVLLCSLRPHVLPSASPRSAFFKAPRSLVEARENIAGALRDLSDAVPPSVCDGYTGSQAVEAILLGDRQVVYGLLWHLWQHFNARELTNDQPSRPDSRSGESITPPEGQPTPIVLDIPAFTLAEEGERLLRQAAGETSARQRTDGSQRSAGQLEIAWEPHADGEGGLFPIKTEDTRRDDSEPEGPVNEEPDDDVVQCDGPQEKVVPTADRPPPRAEALHTLKRQLSRQRQPTPPVQVNQQQLAAVEKHADAVLKWLRGLGIRLEHPEAFHDPTVALTDFQSGVTLCRIVEKVEFLRGIPGVVAPKDVAGVSRASALHNLSKALAILQHKTSMPPHLLRRATSIYKGDRASVLRLLVDIRKAFGHHHPKPKPVVDAAQGRAEGMEAQHDSPASD